MTLTVGDIRRTRTPMGLPMSESALAPDTADKVVSGAGLFDTGSTGSGGARNNMQPSLALNYIVKV